MEGHCSNSIGQVGKEVSNEHVGIGNVGMCLCVCVCVCVCLLIYLAIAAIDRVVDATEVGEIR